MRMSRRDIGRFGMPAVFIAYLLVGSGPIAGQSPEVIRPIPPPATPLPSEAQSAGVSRFSFLVYGDTRGRHDGVLLQPDHLLVVEAMLDAIKRRQSTAYPVRFVLQSGDGVVNGADAHQWNQSFVDVVARLTKDGNVPFFMTAGNHDVSAALTVAAPGRRAGLQNFLNVISQLIPAEGSPRRLSGYPTYAFGYGNCFVLTLDSNVADDDTQFAWVTRQLDALDTARYVNVVVFFHHPVFSSGPHGGLAVEASTLAIRSRYMPLFNAHHVKVAFTGHDHLFEQWVEHYSDASGPHRMDLVVTGGGGAPPYAYQGEPDTKPFLQANTANKVSLEHLVKPGPHPGDNPYHFVIVRVDGERLSLEVVGVDWGTDFRPYRTNTLDLQGP
jgi:Calcineurin-like phosphoesterase